ncbi:MAG TPA: peptidylprolyl isomerase, partial [Kofleriaceae bacterium]|nr:peptidylprolyl isomerase [Kofleriaceae bacterium]
GSAPGSAGSGSGVAIPAAPAIDLDSKDILARPAGTGEVFVKHVLIAWKDLAKTLGKRIDKRALDRSNADAAKLATEVLGKLKADPKQIDALMDQYSEDPGRATGDPYPVKADTHFVEEFKKLALRLNENEAGIVKSQFGYHVMLRVPPPPPDPLESADILKRTPETGGVWVQYILIGWKGHSPDPKAARAKADADKIAKETLDKANAKEDFAKLMKDSSDDPRAKDSQTPHEVTPRPKNDDPIESLALRLKLDEAGLVKTKVGWLLLKRVGAPPPDPLTSVDILKRTPETKKSKVEHILLGWKDAHTDDPRGLNRSRADLEKLVKDTLARLKKGDKFEAVMKDVSEDSFSAKEGKPYDVEPNGGMQPPFENMSLRLKVNEIGVVKTDFGIHIIKRLE